MKIKMFSRYFSAVVFYSCVFTSFFDNRISLVLLVWLLMPVIFSFLGYGRRWCGIGCPQGIFYDDYIGRIISDKVSPKVFSNVFLRCGLVIVLIAMLAAGVYKSFSEPWAVGRYAFIIVTAICMCSLILTFQFSKRTWCHVCPVGSLAAAVSVVVGKKYGIECSGHKFSAGTVCPMGVDSRKHPDCIHCCECCDIRSLKERYNI